MIVFGLFGSGAIAQNVKVYDPPNLYHLESSYKGMKLKYMAYQFDITTGLNTNSINQLTEDSYGRIWYATANSGFSAIDGENMYHFGSHNGFFDRYSRIHTDMDGKIWVGGNGVGVAYLEDGYKINRFFDIGNDISDVHIQAIKNDSKNNVWVSTRLGGITCFAEDTTYLFSLEDLGLSADGKFGGYIIDLTIDSQDRIWAIANKKIFYIEDGKVNHLEGGAFSELDFWHMGPDGQDYIIVSDVDRNYYKISNEQIEPFEVEFPSDGSSECWQYKVDKEGVLYMRNWRNLYRIVDGQAQEMLNSPEHFRMQDFLFDHNNSLWIATDGNGIFYVPKFNLLRMDGMKLSWMNEQFKIFYSDGYIMNASLDRNRKLDWDTLFTFPQGDRFRQVLFPPGGALFDIGNKKYFVNNDMTMNPQKARKYQDFVSVSYDHGVVYARDKEHDIFIEDQAGVLKKADFGDCNKSVLIKNVDGKLFFWIHRNKYNYAIYSYDKGESELIIDNIGGDSLQVTGCHYVNDTTYIIPTWGLFIQKVTPNTCTIYPRNLGSNIVYAYRSDELNNMWVGGIEGGVNYFNANTDSAVNIKPNNGLSGSRVMDLGISYNNDCMIGTDLGLDIFYLKDPEVEVRTEEDFFKRYKHRKYLFEDGLIGSNFRYPYMDRDGNIWFKSTHGTPHIVFTEDTTEFRPDHLMFESIVLEEKDKAHKTIFNWTPGREYNAPFIIEMNYNESLLLTVHSIFFESQTRQEYTFKIDHNNWTKAHKSPSFRIAGLSSGNHRLEFKAIAPNGEESDVISLDVIVGGPIYQSALFWVIVIPGFLLLVFLVFRWRIYVIKERERVLEATVEERTEEIQLAKIEIETQHNEIKDSIGYAKRIQEAILPAPRLIKALLPESFVLYKPKDIVAGDFYWFEEIDDTIIFAAADCTGHGVPGAMVSVVCHNALERSVREFNLKLPGEILDKTRELVIETFEKSESNVKDGMDIAVCSINRKTLELNFAGANNPIYLIKDGELSEIKGDKQPIGTFENKMPFTNHKIKLEKGNLVYSFTDGFADQFGGVKGKKFKYKPFKELLSRNWQKSMPEQASDIDKIFEEWKGDLEQVDDVCVIGVRV